jgi:hypothetical protein
VPSGPSGSHGCSKFNSLGRAEGETESAVWIQFELGPNSFIQAWFFVNRFGERGEEVRKTLHYILILT